MDFFLKRCDKPVFACSTVFSCNISYKDWEKTCPKGVLLKKFLPVFWHSVTVWRISSSMFIIFVLMNSDKTKSRNESFALVIMSNYNDLIDIFIRTDNRSASVSLDFKALLNEQENENTCIGPGSKYRLIRFFRNTHTWYDARSACELSGGEYSINLTLDQLMFRFVNNQRSINGFPPIITVESTRI